MARRPVRPGFPLPRNTVITMARPLVRGVSQTVCKGLCPYASSGTQTNGSNFYWTDRASMASCQHSIPSDTWIFGPFKWYAMYFQNFASGSIKSSSVWKAGMRLFGSVLCTLCQYKISLSISLISLKSNVIYFISDFLSSSSPNELLRNFSSEILYFIGFYYINFTVISGDSISSSSLFSDSNLFIVFSSIRENFDYSKTFFLELVSVLKVGVYSVFLFD
jgi:hypothetical protein